MEIKINCLRNVIEQGGVSKGPATLLDGYGTYLYDLYKPSDADVAAHPELADEPLGIVYPTGNVAFTLMKNITFIPSSNKYYNDLEPEVQFVCSCFPPSMYREIFKNGTQDKFTESKINYLKGIAPLVGSPYFDHGRHYYYFTVIEDHRHLLSVEPDYKISLTEAYKLDTGQENLGFNGVDKYAEWWEDYNDETDPTVLNSTAYKIELPIFCFLTPSSNGIETQLSADYNSYFAADKVSKINKADLEYYKKSAVLIYKKDLMDFKNFCGKILSYGDEIKKYSETVLNSLYEQQG